MKRFVLGIVILLPILAFLFPWVGSAQADEITWGTPVNISNSPEKTSTDPFLLADPAGYVHLFWSEKVTNDPGEQPDTILYTVWDGNEWRKPVDIFLAPLSDGNPTASYPHGVMDQDGNIHLIWMQQPNAPNYAVYYSSVAAGDASSAQAWKKPLILADDLTGSKYSVHIAYTPPATLHVAFARVPMGDAIGEQRAVGYLRSEDGGETWTDPVDVFTAPSMDTGVSDTRLLTVGPDKVFLSWTLWDGSGNGQAVYFARSMDGGQTWSRPIRLAERQGAEYERDWNNLFWLGGDRIGAFWEGGWRAYRYAMYSSDNGVTWSEPIDTFPWLIGDNGFIEFARDSNDVLHLFLAQRIREGHEERGELFGLWHSVYEGGARWRDPALVTRDETAIKNITNPKVAITNGNRVVATWYGSGVYEIWVVAGTINSAPNIPPVAWETPSGEASSPIEGGVTPTQVIDGTTMVQSTPAAEAGGFSNIPPASPDQGTIILLGVMPALVIVAAFILIQQFRGRGN